MKKTTTLIMPVLTLALLASCAGGQPQPTATFTVTFNGNGGTLISGKETQTVSSASEIVAPTYEKGGYSFSGWDTDITKIVSDTTVKALWKETGTEITIDGFVQEGNAFKRSVNYNVDGITFTDKVHVNDGCTWKLYKDAEGKVEIPTKTILLKTGDNLAYILVTSSTGKSAFYIVAIRRLALFTVSFNTGIGGSYIEPQFVQEGNLATKPSDPTKEGYTFSKWDRSFDEPIMGDETFDAIWTSNQYTITFDPNGGSCETLERAVDFGTYVTLPTPTKVGYNFLGWYYGATKIESGVWQIAKNITLKAKWSDPIVYNIFYELNGGINNPSNPSTYTAEDTITFQKPTKDNYTFVGWTKNGNPITGIPKGSIGDVTITANWSISKYQVNVYTNDENKGTVSGGGSFDYGSSVTVTATPINNCVFKGWYTNNEYKILVTKEASYTFTVPSGGISLYAEFWTQAEEETWNKNHGVVPVVSGNTLTYGLYPQTHVNDDSLVEELKKVAPEADEEYFFYDNEYYVKDTGNPFNSSYTFLDGTTVEKGATYFFKCEPIKWNIKGTSTNYTIDCSNILYTHRFAESSNAYANSELRTWLNGDFYNKAFSIKTTSSHIVPTSLSDVFVVSDNVWVGSKDQYETWYTSNEARQKKPSDFALCNFAYMSTFASHVRTGHYWTRSPGDNSNSVWYVDVDGTYYHYLVSETYSVSPCLTIKIN